MQALTTLDLSWNEIRLSGAESILGVLGKNQSLTHLNLAWNGLGDSEMEYVGEYLGGN